MVWIETPNLSDMNWFKDVLNWSNGQTKKQENSINEHKMLEKVEVESIGIQQICTCLIGY